VSDNPVKDFNDLLARLDALTEDAAAGEADPIIVDYLRTTRERVVQLRHRVSEDRRTAERFPEEGEVRLVVEGEALAAEIRDRSDTGFGLVVDKAVAPDTYARLDIDGPHEGLIYEGIVTHCQQEEGRFRVGLDVFSSLRIG